MKILIKYLIKPEAGSNFMHRLFPTPYYITPFPVIQTLFSNNTNCSIAGDAPNLVKLSV